MNKALKYSLYGVGGIVGLALVGAGVLAATFDPNDYKPLIVNLVKEKKQRTLNIEGDIKLAFWPKLGADLGKVSLSEHNGDKEFASINSAKVFVAVLPLLKKELVIDTIHVDGVRANIVRYKDGTTNFDDLISKEEESEELKFDIDGIEVSDGSVSLTDEMGNRHFKLSDMQLETGHVAKNEPVDVDTKFHIAGDNPVLDAKMQFKGTLLADTEKKQYGVKGMALAVQGTVTSLRDVDLTLAGDVDAKPETNEYVVDGLKLAVKATQDAQKLDVKLEAPKLVAQKDQVSGDDVKLDLTRSQDDDTMTAKLVIADMKGSPKAFESSGISGDISGKQGKRSLSGKFSSPFKGNLETLVFDLPKLAGNVDIKDPSLPNGAAKVGFNLNTHLDVKQEKAAVGLAMNIDGSNLKGDVGVAGFKQSNVKFNLTADQLDLNKLLGANQKKEEKPKAAADNKPADLSFLKTVVAEGSINIGSLLYDKYRVSNLAAKIKADGKMLAVSPLSLKLDDSTVKGRVGISQFERALYTFDLDIDRIDADRYVAPASDAPKGPAQPKSDKPLDLSALKALNADGSLRIGGLKYGKTNASNIRIDLKSDGQKLDIAPFSAKVDDSQVKANLGITRFERPVFSFDVDIDKLDADRYITKSEAKSGGSTQAQDQPLDLSALKNLNATGSAKLGWLKLANVKTTNVNVGLKASDGLVTLAPFAANLYDGSMDGTLSVDARATPSIAFKQDMKGINIGPLLVDAIQNDMLEGKGTLAVDVKTSGDTVLALKKALGGTAAIRLADGAVKGVDIAGTIRDIKNKLNFSGNTLGADQKKRTDFSEMSASFKIAKGVAHNEDLSMKSPLLRVTGSGDIDIGNSMLNYTARPTVVNTTKGQGGAEMEALNGLTFPVKVTGPFSAPKYGFDFAAIGTEIAKKNLLKGTKAEPLQQLLEGNKEDALKGLLDRKKKKTAEPPAPAPAQQEGAAAPPAEQQAAPAPAQSAPQEKPKLTPEEKAKKKLNELLGL
jgi:uncharacterized protein involved in outer membrane biogenesis